MTDLFTDDPRTAELMTAARQSLTAIGYQPDLIRADYLFRSAQKHGPAVQQIPLAAFAQTPPSERNSCLGIALPPDHSPESIRRFRDLGAPQIIALHPAQNIARRWKMTADLPQTVGEFGLDALRAQFEARKQQWAPTRIFQAKRALPAELPALADQLDFFDLGFMPALEADLRKKLDQDIQSILDTCRNKYGEFRPETPFVDIQEPAFRLIFRLVAAKMLIDRGEKADWRELPVAQVLANVDDYYFKQKAAEPPLDDSRVQAAVWQKISRGLNLQNLSVETLAYVYENTFVTKAARRDLGIHATPPQIAEFIVRHLPIEKLPEQKRIVFEPFTGPAPFLVAAMGRLRELSTASDEAARHDYFRRMLSGIEADPFAHEIARYSLILADYPNPDGWRIARTDAYTAPEFDQYLQEASIVLCNPPFGSFPARERPEGTQMFRRDAEALRRVLLHPPAFLGFVLPRTFLMKRVYQSVRQKLNERYQDISIVELPGGIFKKADVETVLVIAHNETSVVRRHFGRITREGRAHFLHTGEVRWEEGKAGSLWLPPGQHLWDFLADFPKLGAWAKTHTGLRYKKGIARAERVSESPSAGYEPGIYEPKGFLEPFLPVGHQYLSEDREKLFRNPILPWDQPKVIINAFRSTVGLWRIFGATDYDGLRFTQQCHGLWPERGLPVGVLAAVINGPVANAYLANHQTERDNQIAAVEQIPFPLFAPEQIQSIVGLVQDYQSCREEWLVEPDRAPFLSGKCRELLWQIDAEVLAAYALPPDLERDLLARFTGAARRPLPFSFPGYGEGYEQAKQALAREKEYQTTLAQYHALVDKKYGDGLTATEAETMERLGREIDRADAPFYAPILRDLQASGK